MRRVNLLHAHGSPTGYQYHQRRCRCAVCSGERSAYFHNRRSIPNVLRRESASHRLRLYGVTADTEASMLDAQGQSCAICRADSPGGHGTWHIDHDHGSGVVRGLLCHRCNAGLGFFRDDPGHLMAAIEYLAAAT